MDNILIRRVIKLASLGFGLAGWPGFNEKYPELIPRRETTDAMRIRRQRCLKIDLFSGDGVVEFHKLGMQEISSIAGEAGEVFKRLAG